ncbi:hypothetical protein F0U44_07090 [Nocardioides humilatus]|uniref:Uncharacterized protein n=2 Tax=Nocardioides humilatus TaxID=2607660 RepID=A0A5B1LIS3_9ACTN|nr:hypothetical protein F0U44_07090 [Nocardioides humilatus]
MAANDDSIIHNDGWQTDTYDRSGPVGPDLVVSSTSSLIRDCSSLSFLPDGTALTVCIGVGNPQVKALDPDTLAQIATYPLPKRDKGLLPDTSNFSGGYFYLDHLGRLVVSTAENHVLWLRLDGEAFTLDREVDLSGVIGTQRIQSVLPDWSNRIWFVTQEGTVGYIGLRGEIRTHPLPGEVIANSFAIDESGGVFVVSDHALYRFDGGADRPVVTWRKTYDRGTRVKPSQVSQGSGTTPTLIGRASLPSGGWIAITDNADPQMNVVVFKRGKAGPGAAPVCQQPVFPANAGADENSLISVPGGLIAENNYGYLFKKLAPRQPTTTPGLVKVAVDYNAGTCRIAWHNDTARVPSSVSKASLGSGLVYAYTHPAVDELAYALPLPLGALAPDAWYLTAFSIRTGRQVWSRYVGSGLLYNNHYAAVSLGPDGTAYVGTVGGVVRIADRP